MELIGESAFLNNYANIRNDKSELEHTKQKLKMESHENNIYSRDIFTKVNKKYENLIKNAKIKKVKQSSQSQYDLFTENDSQFSDEDATIQGSSACSSADPSNPLYFLNRTRNLVDNRKHERKVAKKVRDDNNFLRQFDDLAFDTHGDPVSVNAVPNQYGMNAAVARMENERGLGLNGGFSNFGEDGDMTYGIVDRDHFVHNNMKPFFKKGSNPASMQHNAEISQQKMELFSGLDRTDWKHKQEQTPLFSPIMNMKNTYGDPVMTGFYESRYIPGHERRNELPFQQQKVAPGLGFGAKGGGGFTKGVGDLYRVLPKTVDELRPLTRPKVTYQGVVVEGQKGSRGPIIGKVIKKRPEKFKEYNTGDLVANHSQVEAPKIIGEVDPNTLGRTNRGLLREVYYGPTKAVVDKTTPTHLRGQYKKSFRQTFNQAEARGMHFVEGLVGRSNGLDDTYLPDPTKRDTHKIDRQGNQQGEFQKGHSIDFTNVPDPTKREIYKIDRYGNQQGEFQKGHSIDYKDIPNPTKREIHKIDRYGNQQGEFQKGHSIDYNDIPDSTKREIHKIDRYGNQQGEFQKGHSIDYNDIPDPTRREMFTIDRQGGQQGEYVKGQAVDFNDLPDPTKRDIHKVDRHGNQVGEYVKGQAIDFNDIPDPTKRDIHRIDRHGNQVGEYVKGQAIDFNDIPDPTKRDIHKNDRHGNQTGEYVKGQAIDFNDLPDPTKRDIHKNDRHGNQTGEYVKGQAIDFNDLPDPTKRDIHKIDRHGNQVGEYVKGQAVDFNDIPDPTRRDIHKIDRHGNQTGEYVKGQAVDFNDLPDPTKRDIHKVDRHGNQTGEYVKGQAVDFNDIPDPTRRDIHKVDRHGNQTGEYVKGQAIDFNDLPDPTRRDIHKIDRHGNQTGEYVKGQAVDFNDLPDPTKRDMYKVDRHGNQTGNYIKGQAIDYNDIPEATNRDMYKVDHHGNQTGNYVKGQAIDYNDVPDATKRDMYKYKDVGNAKYNIEQTYVINYADATPDVTQREITGATNYIGPGHHGIDAPRNRRDAYNSKVNITREVISKGRTPTVVNYNKGPTNIFTTYEFKDGKQIDRTNAGSAPLLQTTDRLPFDVPKHRNEKWYANTRINQYTQENLDGNPFINNIINKSVITYN